ncbi:MAG: hypothetical protein RSD27_02435 [Ruthenibacterium sp.]
MHQADEEYSQRKIAADCNFAPRRDITASLNSAKQVKELKRENKALRRENAQTQREDQQFSLKLSSIKTTVNGGWHERSQPDYGCACSDCGFIHEDHALRVLLLSHFILLVLFCFYIPSVYFP